MPIELGSVSLEHLTHVAVREHTRLVRHAVPGMSGDLIQVLGRPSVEVLFRGIFYGAEIDTELQALRQAYLAHQPVDFFTETIGEGYFSQVLIAHLEITQRAGVLDQYDFACEVVEYVEPPEPVAADPFGALNDDLLGEATAFMDDVQNALEQVSQLTDLIANIPSFGDPTERLGGMLDSYTGIVSGGTAVLGTVRELF